MPTDDLRALAEAVMPLNDEGLAHIKEQARSLHPDYPNGIHWHNRTVLALLDHLDKLEAALSEERIAEALHGLHGYGGLDYAHILDADRRLAEALRAALLEPTR
jgi:hypothetical protein